MNKYTKNYSIEWYEECEAESFEEAERIMDKIAKTNPHMEGVDLSEEVELIE